MKNQNSLQVKKLVSIIFVAFLTFNVCAQKTPKWIDHKAAIVSQDIQTVLELSDEQTAKMYDEEVKKLMTLDKAKANNGGKNLSKEVRKVTIAPYVASQTEVAGGNKK